MKRNLTRVIMGSAVLVMILLLSLAPSKSNKSFAFHTPDEVAFLKSYKPTNSTIDSSTYFLTHLSCEGCHGFDLNEFASIDEDGYDVNVVDDWKATMMANSAKDPFWRAKISHEILLNPGLTTAIEDKCTQCHAPMGNYQHKFDGNPHYAISDMLGDTLGLDGVSCGACHQQSPEDLGFLFSGELRFDTTQRVIYGPYTMPFMGPMSSFVGFEPAYSEHINDAGICAGCHSLVTETVDLNGTLTGATFVEQATYHEWLNSAYNGVKVEVSCQECHMPRIDDGVVISSNYLFLQPRSPFGQHTLVGANTLMLQLMKDNKDALGLFATDANFDSTLASTFDLLQNQTLDFDLTFDQIENDTAFFKIDLVNLAGHKFPSGYPSRRAFIEFLVLDDQQDTLFHSGKLDAQMEVEGHSAPFEPHYDRIAASDQVQIYETVVGDVNGDYTSILERGASTLKDNRLTPLGFVVNHPAYDTAAIIGNALNDPNFNFSASGTEGSGSDRVYYDIPLNGYTGMIDVQARVWYQSLPPKFLEEMFAANTPEINTFKAMFDATDQSAVLVAGESIDGIVVTDIETPESTANQLNIFPNPARDGWVTIEQSNQSIDFIRVYSNVGQLIQEHSSVQVPFQLRLPETSGLYIIEVYSEGRRISKKVLRQP